MAKTNVDTISVQTQAPQSNEPLLSADSRIFKLSNDKRMGKAVIDVEEDVIDPATGKQRRMRLLRGANSIWFDEQPPTVFPQKYVEKNTLNLEFEAGVMILQPHDKLKIQAAELTFANVGTRKKHPIMAKYKPFMFYEWNPKEQNAAAIKEENDVIKAMQLAMTTPYEEMKAHAQYLGIQFHDEMGVSLDEEALRMAYTRYAKNNAKKFLNSINSPTVKLNDLVRGAIAKGRIDLGKQPGTAYWTDGGFISALPTGRDEVDFLVEFAALPGEANALFQNQLKELDKT